MAHAPQLQQKTWKRTEEFSWKIKKGRQRFLSYKIQIFIFNYVSIVMRFTMLSFVFSFLPSHTLSELILKFISQQLRISKYQSSNYNLAKFESDWFTNWYWKNSAWIYIKFAFSSWSVPSAGTTMQVLRKQYNACVKIIACALPRTRNAYHGKHFWLHKNIYRSPSDDLCSQIYILENYKHSLFRCIVQKRCHFPKIWWWCGQHNICFSHVCFFEYGVHMI